MTLTNAIAREPVTGYLIGRNIKIGRRRQIPSSGYTANVDISVSHHSKSYLNLSAGSGKTTLVYVATCSAHIPV
jgi:hypothetical protein